MSLHCLDPVATMTSILAVDDHPESDEDWQPPPRSHNKAVSRAKRTMHARTPEAPNAAAAQVSPPQSARLPPRASPHSLANLAKLRLLPCDATATHLIFSFLVCDPVALNHMERTCKRGYDIASTLGRAPGAHPAWRLHQPYPSTIPKRARETIDRILRPSARMGKHLLTGTCCVCQAKWSGAVLESGIFAHEKCAREFLINKWHLLESGGLNKTDHPLSQDGTKRSLLRELQARPLRESDLSRLPSKTLMGYSAFSKAKYEYEVVWLNKHWAVPDAATVEHLMVETGERPLAQPATPAKKRKRHANTTDVATSTRRSSGLNANLYPRNMCGSCCSQTRAATCELNMCGSCCTGPCSRHNR